MNPFTTPVRRARWPAAIAAAWLAASAHAGRAAGVQPIEVRLPASGAAFERTFFIGTGASLEEAVALRDHLRRAGARHVNLFLPDLVVVCDLPAGVSLTDRAAAFRVEPAGDGALSPERFALEPWGWIAEAYANVDRAATAPAPGAPAGAPFDDVVLTISPERAAQVQRDVERAARERGLSPRALPARQVSQNSEFLGGTTLANFIYPESDGSRENDSETWTDAELRDAKQGAAQGLISWQGRWPTMDISWSIRNYERVPTGYEPIQHDMNTDEAWINDTMRSLGFGLLANESVAIVHDFNEAMRVQVGTQWVVTSFIANSRTVGTHRFGGGSANYTAYAYLGGPYMVEPFPAGSDPNLIGETLVFSQIAQHEIGHCFWTLDEYPGSPSPCAATSGYLNYPNSNVTLLDPGGGEVRCTALQPCIMHTATRLDLGRPWCTYSQGHLGVADANDNGKPDIFEAAPTVEFEIAGPETVTTNAIVLRFRAVSQAVPNRNVRIHPDRRVSYAATLRRGWFALGEQTQYTLNADDGSWDEIVEEGSLRLGLAQVGLSVITLRAENDAGMVSAPHTKKIYFTGVRYTGTAVTVRPGKIDVTWDTAGEVFGAKFDVFRLEPGEQLPGTPIAREVAPSSSAGGFDHYRYTDRDITPGRDYRYYVEGYFTLPYAGGTREYRSASRVIAQTAMISSGPGGLLSNVAPNPSRGPFTVSVQVPRTYGGTPSAPTRLATPLEVAVYDVRGRRVRLLRQGSGFDDVVTVRWDGTDARSAPAPSGVYFVRARAGAEESVRKFVLIR
jgi:hypothetical protein